MINKVIEKVIIPLPSVDIQNEIVSNIINEISLVKSNKQLIEIFEQKIKDRIAKVWGEEKPKEYKLEDEQLGMVAEQ